MEGHRTGPEGVKDSGQLSTTPVTKFRRDPESPPTEGEARPWWPAASAFGDNARPKAGSVRPEKVSVRVKKERRELAASGGFSRVSFARPSLIVLGLCRCPVEADTRLIPAARARRPPPPPGRIASRR
jgi:hypothetical protein